jgi:hypothetical protein
VESRLVPGFAIAQLRYFTPGHGRQIPVVASLGKTSQGWRRSNNFSGKSGRHLQPKLHPADPAQQPACPRVAEGLPYWRRFRPAHNQGSDSYKAPARLQGLARRQTDPSDCHIAHICGSFAYVPMATRRREVELVIDHYRFPSSELMFGKVFKVTQRTVSVSRFPSSGWACLH